MAHDPIDLTPLRKALDAYDEVKAEKVAHDGTAFAVDARQLLERLIATS